MAKPKTDTQRPNWDPGLFFAWLAGVLSLLTPYQLGYQFGSRNIGDNIVISLVLVAGGVVVVVGLLHLQRRLVLNARHETSLVRWTTRAHTVAALLFGAALVLRSYSFYWAGVAALGVWMGMLAVRSRDREGWRPMNQPQPWRCNSAFWMLVFLLLFARDLWSLAGIGERRFTETFLILLGRFFSLATLVTGLLIATEILTRFFPKRIRWLVIVAASMAPVIVVADFLAEIAWQHSLVEVVNSLALGGGFNMKEELEAAEIHKPVFEIAFYLFTTVFCAVLAYLGLQRLAVLRVPTGRILCVFTVLWLGAIVQQAVSMIVIRREVWQAEHETFKVHLGLLHPEPGLETIPVRFVETQSEQAIETLLAEDLPTLERKPDVFVFIVETWRADTIRPEVTPFLDKFRTEACQEFGVTFAGSNCTPASWFTLFHSRLAIHWEKAVAKRTAPGGLRGAYPLRLLNQLGYECQLRAVSDLSYKDIGELNFGSENSLTKFYMDLRTLPGGRPVKVPRREVIIMDALKQQLLADSVGGKFHVVALDSPHNNYSWPEEGFEPLHHDFAERAKYPLLNPSPDDIRQIVKRYENSVHWIDHQLEEFIGFLRAQQRYDDAVIIITGDHGEEFKEHGGYFHCSNLKRPQIEVPLMIKWPHWIKSPPPLGQATHLDVMPSLLDALGLDARYFANLAGRSTLRANGSREAVLTSPLHWTGLSRVAVCFVKDSVKANFAYSAVGEHGVPDTLHFMGFTNLADAPHDIFERSGDLRYAERLRRFYPQSIGHFFSRFGED